MARKVRVCNLSEIAEFDPARLRRLVHVLDGLPGEMRAPDGWLSVAVMDDDRLAEIHASFMGDPSKTDVITFEGDPDDGFAGEICVSAERALEVAGNYGNSPDAELCLYVAHGLLHLAGIDDIEPEDAKKMREAEAEAAALIGRKFKKAVFKFKGESNV